MDSTPSRPNVLLIMTDDLTWGDLGCHGNTVSRTPALDQLYKQSTHLTRHYAGPMCTPSRAALMTGRYPYRTRAIDTYCGRSMMDPDERTLAEILRDAGYRTGLFGKWHLGDCHPMRPPDKGFDESLVHGAGGLGAPGNPTANDGYFNPDLRRNGKVVPSQGYCTDIFADETIAFIESNQRRPFFAFLATNAPHNPFEIDDKWVRPHREKGINELHARVYGMIENLDMNIGRVLTRLDELGLTSNTIVIFTSDHGWCRSTLYKGQHRFNGGLRDGKGSMYNGGLLVPSFWRWPGQFAAGRNIDTISNPIDILPTLAHACGAEVPQDRKIDGTDLLPLLRGNSSDSTNPKRQIFVQWHRGDIPQRWRNCCVITPQWKLVDGRELYASSDWPEQNDVSGAHPEVIATLRKVYEDWFDDVSTTRGPGNFDPPLIHLGTLHESPTYLTRQDWRVHGEDGWGDLDAGHWEVHLARPGTYTVTLRFTPQETDAIAHLQFAGTHLVQPLQKDATSCTFENVPANIGPGRIEAWLTTASQKLSPRIVEIA